MFPLWRDVPASPAARPIEEVGHSSSSVVTRIARCGADRRSDPEIERLFCRLSSRDGIPYKGGLLALLELQPLIYLATANVTNWILCSSLLMLGYVCAGLSIILP